MRLFLAATLLFFFSSLDVRVQSQTPREDGQVQVPEQASLPGDAPADPASTPEASLLSAVTGVDAADDPAPTLPAPVEASMDDICSKLAVAAQESGIPAPFLARLIWQESRFRSREVSPVGAQGMAQFMPATALEEGLDDPFDPLKAIPAAAGFLRKLHRQFGNLGLAAAAYNAGGGRIRQWLARRGPLPQETRDYVRKVTGNDAETWIAQSRTVPLSLQLPRQAPCEGVAGLSRDKQVALMPGALSAEAGDLIRKAEAEARAAAEAAAKARAKLKGKARLLMANAQMRGPTSAKRVSIKVAIATPAAAKPTASKTALKTAASARAKPAKLRVASAAR
jgi:hypothetical protein